ncbi:RNA polymerase sigma factor [Alteromonas sp. CYL-A6]|uniref:RNA polymerase sigma factor n=1 Tax=Alteromonas nitratireducens TaxID=3390813 RepID=UPI0034A72B12
MTQDFDAVFSEYSGLLSRVASAYEANDALRQELLQDIAVAVWQGLARFNGNASLKTYILKIAHNRGVSHVATQVRHQQVTVNDALTADAPDLSASPEQASVHSQALDALLMAVRDLPLPQRQVLTLSLEGLSYDEIATVCGINKNHVGVLLNRAKAAVTGGKTYDEA